MREYIILADGEFPTAEQPLKKLKNCSHIVCCDGAADKLIDAGIIPEAIVGDIDSLSGINQHKFKDIIVKSDCQQTNDLTKALQHTINLNPTNIIILGATGIREDHTLGNISLLFDYSLLTTTPVQMWTNYGIFMPLSKGKVIECAPGTQISLFSLDTNLRMKSTGLKYPLEEVIFDSWWKATLNECTGENFELIFEKGRVILFLEYQTETK